MFENAHLEFKWYSSPCINEQVKQNVHS